MELTGNYNGPKNLSGLPNTPELNTAIAVIQRKVRGDYTFHTTMGHIVTKILDLNITFMLPDGSQYRPFSTVGDVNSFFRITANAYATQPNPFIIDHFIADIYSTKVAPRVKELLEPKRKVMKGFLEQNLWRSVSDTDTLDTLFVKIDTIAQMKIPEVTECVCSELKEWIVMNSIGMSKTMNHWNTLSEEERCTYIVQDIEKEKYTDYFANLVVDQAWENNPNNPRKYMMNVVQFQLHALYRISHEFQRSLGKASPDQFRSTRYL